PPARQEASRFRTHIAGSTGCGRTSCDVVDGPRRAEAAHSPEVHVRSMSLGVEQFPTPTVKQYYSPRRRFSSLAASALRAASFKLAKEPECISEIARRQFELGGRRWRWRAP